MVVLCKQKTAYEMLRSLVGSEMCIRDSGKTMQPWQLAFSDYYKYITTRTCLAQAAGPPGR